MATPFIVCRNMMLSPADVVANVNDAEMSDHCAGMMMSAKDSSPEAESVVFDDVSTTDADGTFFQSLQDCDYLCQVGRCMTPFDAADSLIVVSSFLARAGDFYIARFVAAPVEVHFRPPINT